MGLAGDGGGGRGTALSSVVVCRVMSVRRQATEAALAGMEREESSGQVVLFYSNGKKLYRFRFLCWLNHWPCCPSVKATGSPLSKTAPTLESCMICFIIDFWTSWLCLSKVC